MPSVRCGFNKVIILLESIVLTCEQCAWKREEKPYLFSKHEGNLMSSWLEKQLLDHIKFIGHTVKMNYIEAPEQTNQSNIS